MRIFSGLLIVLTLLFVSCGDPIPGELPVNNVVPLSVGNTWLYEVSGTEYTPLEETQFSYQIQDSITDMSIQDDVTVFDILRSVRTNENEEWRDSLNWTIREMENQLIYTYSNTSVIHVVFPIHEGLEFDANAFNSMPSDIFSVEDVGQIYQTLSEQTFQNTFRVVHEDNDDFIVNLEQKSEIFALEIGLIERIEKDLVYCQDPGCLGNEQVEEGIELIMTLTNYTVN